MTAAETTQASLDRMAKCLPDPRALAPAREAWERFERVNEEIVRLSRRNSNVRALALTLGRKRTIAAEAEMQLTALEDTLKTHEFRATR